MYTIYVRATVKHFRPDVGGRSDDVIVFTTGRYSSYDEADQSLGEVQERVEKTFVNHNVICAIQDIVEIEKLESFMERKLPHG